MGEQGLSIAVRDGVTHLSGVLNEFADLSALLKSAAPLRLNMRHVTRLNSIGVRNLLKFLSEWGDRAFYYEECPSEFIDQINMIPALLGNAGRGQVKSLFVPYECAECDAEEEVLADAEAYREPARQGRLPTRTCGKCGGKMSVLTDAFFVFLAR
jgi:hypothetical protein